MTSINLECQNKEITGEWTATRLRPTGERRQRQQPLPETNEGKAMKS